MHKRASSNEIIPPHVQSPNRRRPLIEQCTNEWQNSPKDREPSNPKPTSTWLNAVQLGVARVWAVIKAPKFQRSVVVALVTILVSILVWRNFLSMFVAESQAAWETINAEGEAKQDNIFGSNKRVHFPGMTHISQMDPVHLPLNHKPKAGEEKDKRLIFIGDIHGCMAELQTLLTKVKYQPGRDHIVAAGDMINKGPNSLEVIDFLISQDASCVRGNHEDRIILIANDVAGNALKAQTVDSNPETEAGKSNRRDRELATSLSGKQLEWLTACPVILRVGELGSHGEIVVVHGGLVPGIRLEDQDPMSVMNMRIVDLTTHVPSHKASQEGSVPWADFWNKYQKLMPAQATIFGSKHKGHKFQHTTVVYGHDAKRGMQIDTYTKGLDSGCVKGGKLTAWVVGNDGKDQIVQVKSHNALAGAEAKKT